MTHFHWPRFHLPHLHLPHPQLPQLLHWRRRTRTSATPAPAASKSTSSALVTLLMVVGTVLGAAILTTRLQVDLVAAAKAPSDDLVLDLSPGADTEGEPDPFALAKRVATEQELPPQF